MIGNEFKLPLMVFFTSLKEHQFELGIEDYKLLLDALKAGFGLESTKALLFLCKTLWMKSNEQTELFNVLFEMAFLKEKQTFLAQEQEKNLDSITPPNKRSENISILNEKEPKEKVIFSNKRSENIFVSNKKKPPKAKAKEVPRASLDNIPETMHDEFLYLSIEIVDSDRIAGTGKSKASENLYNKKFLLLAHFLGLTENELKQTWRFLEKTEKGELTEKINVAATIDHLIQIGGILVNPIYEYSEKNKLTLITLIDHNGSMVAFNELSDTIAETAYSGAKLRNNIYYFFNTPQNNLFKNKAHTKSDSIKYILRKTRGKDLAILIISDAGAARGTFNQERISATRKFIQGLSTKTGKIAWINPMPKRRWNDTSAYYISKFVPMVEGNRTGLKLAVKILRGQLKVSQISPKKV